MKRILPYRIRDKFYLSSLLDQLLHTLEACPLQVPLKALSYDAQIPEQIFIRLQVLHQHPEDAPNITAEDFHILFANILFRYPTIRLYELPDGRIFFKM
ncbi:MAG: hypothetical protein IPH12_15260 [Saprospirales bacterium]|nr:hypothetical protein [Saprospirales bacterium]MBK8923542.1 hypothetical protein [Saprospirales bacterium]